MYRKLQVSVPVLKSENLKIIKTPNQKVCLDLKPYSGRSLLFCTAVSETFCVIGTVIGLQLGLLKVHDVFEKALYSFQLC